MNQTAEELATWLAGFIMHESEGENQQATCAMLLAQAQQIETKDERNDELQAQLKRCSGKFADYEVTMTIVSARIAGLKAENKGKCERIAELEAWKESAAALFVQQDAVVEAAMGGRGKAGDSRCEVALQRIKELEAEVERLRKRTHEIQAEESRKAGEWEHKYKRMCSISFDDAEVAKQFPMLQFGMQGYIRSLRERIAELETELSKWRPLTPDEAQRAYDEAEAVPMSKDEIDRIFEKALDPAYMPTNQESAQMAYRLARLEAENKQLRQEIDAILEGGSLRRKSE